jgi:hypothetical protein
MTFKSLVLREVARQQEHGRSAGWVAVKGPRSDAIRQLETVAAATRQLRGLDEYVYALRRAHEQVPVT